VRVVDLRAAQGRALLAGVPLDDGPGGRLWGLPPDLVSDLQDWGRVAQSGVVDAESGAAVSRRGRHLAARLSVVLRVPVDYHDPVTGQAIGLRAVSRTTRVPPVPPLEGGTPPPSAWRPEPTPWATGLALAVLVAAITLMTNLALAEGMVTTLGLGGVVVDVLVVAGLTPALWLNRRAPTWRWAVLGTFAGLVAAVPVLLVEALA